MSAQFKTGRHVAQWQRQLESIKTDLNKTLQHAAAQQVRADTLELHD